MLASKLSSKNLMFIWKKVERKRGKQAGKLFCLLYRFFFFDNAKLTNKKLIDFREQGDMKLARNYASKAIQADPENESLRYEYADLCVRAGRYKEAAETYEQIFRRWPNKRIEPLKWGTEV